MTASTFRIDRALLLMFFFVIVNRYPLWILCAFATPWLFFFMIEIQEPRRHEGTESQIESRAT